MIQLTNPKIKYFFVDALFSNSVNIAYFVVECIPSDEFIELFAVPELCINHSAIIYYSMYGPRYAVIMNKNINTQIERLIVQFINGEITVRKLKEASELVKLNNKNYDKPNYVTK